MLLILASADDLKNAVYEVIRVACLRNIMASALVRKSAWVKGTITESEDLNSLFLKLVHIRYLEMDLLILFIAVYNIYYLLISVKRNAVTTQSLVGLAIDFLHFSGEYSKQLNNIGIIILIKLCRTQKSLAFSIISQLMNNIDDSQLELKYSSM